ncbi:hypothetical protein L7F22_036970 [Adiantum nelumboides]|nr:hypothetical protein [Adiantum nelumboides]
MLPRITTAASPASRLSLSSLPAATAAAAISAFHCGPRHKLILTSLSPFLGRRRHLHSQGWRFGVPMVSQLHHRLPPISAVPRTSATMASPPCENAEDTVYQLPPPEIQAIVDAPPTPALSFSPKRDKILFLKRRALPSLSDLARPELKLGGIRIDSDSNTRSRMSFYTGISIHSILEDGSLGEEKEVIGLPESAKINFVSWSKDGCHLAFSVREEHQVCAGLCLCTCAHGHTYV